MRLLVVFLALVAAACSNTSSGALHPDFEPTPEPLPTKVPVDTPTPSVPVTGTPRPSPTTGPSVSPFPADLSQLQPTCADGDHDGYTTPPTGGTDCGWRSGGVTFEDIATTGEPIFIGDQGFATFDLGFELHFFDRTYSRAAVSNFGYVTFRAASVPPGVAQTPLPNPAEPNDMIAAFWEELVPGHLPIQHQTFGSAGSRVAIVQWNDVALAGDGAGTLTFQMQLAEATGEVRIVFLRLPDTMRGHGGNAVIGVEDRSGRRGSMALYHSPVLTSGASVTWLTSGSDCNDADASVHPGQGDSCGGVDDDCDGMTDEDHGAEVCDGADNDCDGHTDDIDVDRDGVSACAGDCDDVDADVNPMHAEVGGDGKDNDCDATTRDRDGDGDGFDSANDGGAGGSFLRSGEAIAEPRNGVLPLSGDDQAEPADLGFDFTFFGRAYSRVWVNTNGQILFGGASTRFSNDTLPDPADPDAQVAVFWDDMCPDTDTQIRAAATGTAPNRRFVVSWANLPHCGGGEPITFRAALNERDGSITFHYVTLGDDGESRGSSATVGVEDAEGELGVTFSHSTPSLSDGLILTWLPAGDDCDDTDADVHPGVTDACNSVDDDCDGATDEDALDADHDHHPVCVDCNDVDATVHPGATDWCNGNVDDDCDGQTDEDRAVETCDRFDNDCDGTTDVRDQDNDGVGLCNGDCDDQDAARRPGAPEISADDKDNDCNPATADDDADGDHFFARATASDAGLFLDSGVALPSLAATGTPRVSGDDANHDVAIGFTFRFFDHDFTRAWVSTNGFITFAEEAASSLRNQAFPDSDTPDGVVAAFWDDLDTRAAGQVLTATVGTAGDRMFVVEWNRVQLHDYAQSGPLTFRLALFESDGRVGFEYVQLDGTPAGAVSGDSATVGIESPDGSKGVTWSHAQASLREGLRLTWLPNNLDCDDTDPLIHPAASEICDTVDNDCNGVIDEGAPDADGDGHPACRDCDDHDAARYPGAVDGCDPGDEDCDGRVNEDAGEEVCDGADNDCDGITDEGVANACGGCGVLPPEVCDGRDNDCDSRTDEDLAPASCASGGAGACAAGRSSCVDGRLTCAGTTAPAAETCNGIDDDCDGMTDEDDPEGGAACPAIASGRCASGTRHCVGGRLQCIAGAARPETCDEADDDCDGATDEDYPAASDVNNCGACGVACVQHPTHVASCAGACVYRCKDGVADANRLAADGCECVIGTERCDGVDNDCNGEVDDVAGGCTCSNGDTRLCGLAQGVCFLATQECVGGAWEPCPGEARRGPELCNAIDDDCDGSTDEGFGVGTACRGLGACSVAGQLECADDGSVRCSSAAAARVETCNAADDDCDGRTDEGNVETCNGADDDCDGRTDEDFLLGVACETGGLGACAVGVRACNDAGGVRCQQVSQPAAAEACDGRDDDCDGGTDEGVRNACGGCGTLAGLAGGPCDGDDADRCALGTFTCSIDGSRLECINERSHHVEICGNGADDDCDGTADRASNDRDTDGDHTPDCADRDDDADGWDDGADNCPAIANVDQADADNDGLGDRCDATPR